MQPYIIFSFIAAISFALAGVFNKFVSKHEIDNKDSMMTYFMLASFLFSFILFPFVSKSILSLSAFQPLIVSTITFLIGYYLFFTAIFQIDVSVFASLFQLQAACVALLAFLFLGERFPLQNYLWILLIILGAVMVSLDERMNVKSFFTRGVLLIIVMQFFHAVSNLFVGFTLKEITFLQVLFWENLVIGALLIPFVLVAKPRLSYPLKSILTLSIATFIGSVGAVFLFRAFQENLTISSSIALMSSPIVLGITILASQFRPELLEHHSLKVYLVRGIGVLLILFGAMRISLSG